MAARQACHDEGMSETETWEFTRRERAYLIDAVMVLMHQMEQVPENDLSEIPDLQRLLERLMSGQSSSPPA